MKSSLSLIAHIVALKYYAYLCNGRNITERRPGVPCRKRAPLCRCGPQRPNWQQVLLVPRGGHITPRQRLPHCQGSRRGHPPDKEPSTANPAGEVSEGCPPAIPGLRHLGALQKPRSRNRMLSTQQTQMIRPARQQPKKILSLDLPGPNPTTAPTTDGRGSPDLKKKRT